MRIEHSHQLGQAQAIQRVDDFVNGLLQRQLPAGVSLTNPQKTWNGNTMKFSFTAAKGFLRTTINGQLVVTDTNVAIDVDVPKMLGAFVGEDQIRQAAAQQLDSLLRT